MNFIEDRLAIQDLTARYAYYLDTFQFDKALDLFTEDSIFDESKIGSGLYEGKPAITGFFAEIKTVVSHWVHNNSNHVIEQIDGNTANAVLFTSFQGLTYSGGKMQASVYYIDDYVKQNGRWLFRKRVLYPVLPIDLDAYKNSQ
jgi:ketosteroid isomerase-like protein